MVDMEDECFELGGLGGLGGIGGHGHGYIFVGIFI